MDTNHYLKKLKIQYFEDYLKLNSFQMTNIVKTPLITMF